MQNSTNRRQKMSENKSNIPASYLDVYNAIKNAEGSITREKIALQLGKADDKNFLRTLSEIINSLIVDYGKPIGSSSKEATKGYFIIDSREKGLEAVNSLRSRALKITERELELLKILRDRGIDI